MPHQRLFPCVGAGLLALSAAGSLSLAASPTVDEVGADAPAVGPAQRAGAEIDRAVLELRGKLGRWYERSRDGVTVAARAGSDKAGAWWRELKLDLLGDPGAPIARPRTLVARAIDPETGTAWRPGSGVRPDAQWVDAEAIKGATLPSAVVVLVHGLDEPGGVWADLMPPLIEAGHHAVRFDYPNDAPIAASADALAASLRDLRTRGVERVAIVGHSMGSLLARDVLTREGHYGGSGAGRAGLPAVERVVMIAAPHAGAGVARLQPVSEAREHLSRALDDTDAPASGLVHSYADGCGEAGCDLLPGSAFLAELNARPLPAGVGITNIVACVLTPGACEGAATLAGDAIACLGFERPGDLRLGGLSDAVGDGLVAASSARLAGVSDEVIVRADHRSVIRRWHILDGLGIDDGKHPAYAPAIPIILDRLAQDAAARGR